MSDEAIEIHFDYRSPYAYFLWSESGGLSRRTGVPLDWHPVSIDVLLNLQAGRAPWAPYEDPLPPIKRRYLFADVARGAEVRSLPMKPPNPLRTNSLLALQTSITLADSPSVSQFRDRVFRAVWEEQRDVSQPAVLAALLDGLVERPLATVEESAAPAIRTELERRTCAAFERGIFGTPSMCWRGEVFFGSDRRDVLEWRVRLDRGA
jgi:2-hydroxychromene-2-carboxylate isomerase